MHGEIRGLPKMCLIKDFLDGLVGPFVEINSDHGLDNKLSWWFAQIAEGVRDSDISGKIAELITLVRVEKTQRCVDGKIVVKYSVRDRGYDIYAKFDETGALSAYTIVPIRERSLRAGRFCIFNMGYSEPMGRDEVIAYFQRIKQNDGGFIIADDSEPCPINVCLYVRGGVETYSFECCYGFDEPLWIESKATSQADMIEFVNAYLEGGMAAAQVGREWYAHWGSEGKMTITFKVSIRDDVED